MAEEKTGRGKQFSEQLKELLQQALALAAEKDGIDAADYRERVEDLDNQLTFHLRDRVLRDQDNQTLLNGVGTQHDKGHVLRFPGEDRVEPTKQPGGKGSAPGGDCAQGFALFQKRAWGKGVRGFHERAPDYSQNESSENGGHAGKTDQPRTHLKSADHFYTSIRNALLDHLAFADDRR